MPTDPTAFPTFYCDEDGDTYEVLLGPETYRGKWLNEYVTLYIDRKSGRVVGFLVTDVSRLAVQVRAASGKPVDPTL